MTELYQANGPENGEAEPQHTIDGQPISEYFANLDYTPEGNLTKFKVPDVLVEFSKIKFNPDTKEQVYNPAVSHFPQGTADNFANNQNILELGPNSAVFLPEPGYGGNVGPGFVAYNIDNDPEVDLIMRVHKVDGFSLFGIEITPDSLGVWIDYLPENIPQNYDYDIDFDLEINDLSPENVSSRINYVDSKGDGIPAFIGSYDPSTNRMTVSPELLEDLSMFAQDKSIITKEPYLESDQYNNTDWLDVLFDKVLGSGN